MKNLLDKSGVTANALIWFGAGVSIAEILTGMLIAPLGFTTGIAAILLGHLIGGTLMLLAGLIGAKTEKCAMETVRISFGKNGSLLFTSLNVVQLVGWTAVMTASGAAAANSVFELGIWAWTLIIGALIALWTVAGLKNLGKINVLAIGALFVLTIVMSAVVFKNTSATTTSGDMMTFGAAVELSAAMPLSWLPLISDYTRNAKRKTAVTVVSTGVYSAVSCWMYIIGLGAALFTGAGDIAPVMKGAGLGVAGLVIIVLSTVTTTYLDVYSGGVSATELHKKIPEKPAALVVCVVGTLIALLSPSSGFESFLYLIGSVFAPMTALLITDYFLLRTDVSEKSFGIRGLALWAIGFALYRVFMQIDTPIGSTLPVMIIISVIDIIVYKVIISVKKKDK